MDREGPPDPEEEKMLALEKETISERQFQFISDLVKDRCGINLHDGKKDLVQARLAKCIRQAGHEDAQAFLDHVKTDHSGEAVAGLIDAMSTNLTSFFRESQHFDYLRETFLPALIAKRKLTGQQRLRGWSAGCSTGEEPYSLAMTLIEAAGSDVLDVKLLATDISRPVLETARQGVYDKARLDSVPVAFRTRYFEPGGQGRFKAGQPLRDVVRFNHLNLMETWPFTGPFDFIFCRNVMIYFDKPTQQRLVSRFYDCLEPGGLLFTGHSESLTGVSHKFKYVLPTIYAK